MKIKIKVVDAFTNVRFKGNPAAVVISGKWLSDEKMQEMDYGRITPLLVKAIQEQQTIIEALEARIKALEE